MREKHPGQMCMTLSNISAPSHWKDTGIQKKRHFRKLHTYVWGENRGSRKLRFLFPSISMLNCFMCLLYPLMIVLLWKQVH